MDTFAIVVVGRDRPGVIADVTGALAAHGGNVEDSSMTLLRGMFAWTLVVSFDGLDAGELERTLEPLREPDLSVTSHPMPDVPGVVVADGRPFQLAVHGADQPGIVSGVTRVLADFGGNVTDLSTRLSGSLFVVIADFDLPPDVDVAALSAATGEAARRLGVTAHVVPADSDLL